MANQSSLYRKNGSLSVDQLYLMLQEINKKSFNNTLNIEKRDKDILFLSEDHGFYWWFNDSPSEIYTSETEYDEVSDNYYTFRDCPRPDYLMWFQEIIIKSLVIDHGLTCYIDSIGEEVEKIPCPSTYKDFMFRYKWYDNNFNNFIIKYFLNKMEAKTYDEDLKYAKSQLSKSLYEEMFINKISDNE